MKNPKNLVYRPKALVPGWKIEEGLTGMYAAVPDKQFKTGKFKIVFTSTRVDDGGNIVAQVLEKEVDKWGSAEKFRRFPDKWGRGMYTLGYFKMSD